MSAADMLALRARILRLEAECRLAAHRLGIAEALEWTQTLVKLRRLAGMPARLAGPCGHLEPRAAAKEIA